MNWRLFIGVILLVVGLGGSVVVIGVLGGWWLTLLALGKAAKLLAKAHG